MRCVFVLIFAFVSILSHSAVYASETSGFAELCRVGTLEEIKEALRKGADINERSVWGTPLIIAVRRADIDPDLYKYLLQRGADVNKANKDGVTPLMLAAWYDETTEVVNLLIKLGADVDQKDSNGRNAYQYARGYRKPNNADWIFFKGSAFQFYLAVVLYMLCWLVLVTGAIITINKYRAIHKTKLVIITFLMTITPFFVFLFWMPGKMTPLYAKLNTLSLYVGSFLRDIILKFCYGSEEGVLPSDLKKRHKISFLAAISITSAIFFWTLTR